MADVIPSPGGATVVATDIGASKVLVSGTAQAIVVGPTSRVPVLSIYSDVPSSLVSISSVLSAWGPFSQGTPSSQPSITTDSVTGQQLVRFDSGKTLTLAAGAADYLSQGSSTVIVVWRQRLFTANADHVIIDSSGNGSTAGYQLQAFDNRTGSEFRLLTARISNGSTWVVNPTNGTSGNYGALKWNVAAITTSSTRAALTSDAAPVYDATIAATLPGGSAGALTLGGSRIDLKALEVYSPALTDAQRDARIATLSGRFRVDIAHVVAGDGYGTQTMNFPGAVRMPNGNLLAAYRHGTGHGNDDGQLETRTSADGGKTWSDPTVIYAPAHNANITPFDPNLAVLSNGDILLSFFPYSAIGLRLMRSSDNGVTWTAPQSVTHNYALLEAASAPILERSGKLYWPVYVKQTGDTKQSIRVYTSTDNGATWPGDVLIANGVSDGRDYAEPGLLNDVTTGRMYCLTRTLSNGMYETTSSDNGATWATAVSAISEGTSASRITQLASGRIVALLRPNNLSAATIYKRIGAGFWSTTNSTSPAPGIDPTAGTMVYGTLLELTPGTITCVYGDQQTNGANGSAEVLCRDWPEWQLDGAMPLVVSPSAPTVAPLASQQFTALGAGNFVWSFTNNNSGGSINSSSGLYTAGSTDHVTDVIRATDLNGYHGSSDTSVTVPFYAPTFTIASNVVTTGGNSSVVGTHFQSGCTATVGGVNAPVTFNSATSLTLACAAHAVGATDVVIRNPDGQSVTGAGGLTYVTITAPTITSVSPNAGPDVFGTSGVGVPVTIKGTQFTTATGAKLGGVSITSFVVVDDQTITGVSAAGTKGAALDVTVTNAAGTGGAGNGFWNYIPAATLLAWICSDLASEVTVVSSKVTAVTDRSGNGRTFVERSSGFGPAYGGTTINSKNTFHNAGSQWLMNTSFPAQADFTTIGVYKFVAVSGYNGIYGFGAFSPAGYTLNSNPDLFWSGDAALTDITYSANDVKTLAMSRVKATPTTVSVWSNGTASAQNPKNVSGAASINTSSGLVVMSDGAGTTGPDVAEHLVFSAVLSTGDRQIVESYLRTKWAHY